MPCSNLWKSHLLAYVSLPMFEHDCVPKCGVNRRHTPPLKGLKEEGKRGRTFFVYYLICSHRHFRFFISAFFAPCQSKMARSDTTNRSQSRKSLQCCSCNEEVRQSPDDGSRLSRRQGGRRGVGVHPAQKSRRACESRLPIGMRSTSAADQSSSDSNFHQEYSR